MPKIELDEEAFVIIKNHLLTIGPEYDKLIYKDDMQEVLKDICDIAGLNYDVYSKKFIAVIRDQNDTVLFLVRMKRIIDDRIDYKRIRKEAGLDVRSIWGTQDFLCALTIILLNLLIGIMLIALIPYTWFWWAFPTLYILLRYKGIDAWTELKELNRVVASYFIQSITRIQGR